MQPIKFKQMYQDTVIKSLIERFNYKTPLEVPRFEKITLNMGVGKAAADKKIIASAKEDLVKISGQKPVTTLARISVAGFKIRKGWPIGCKVTLRGARMFEFLERLIHIVLPRIRDFRGLSVRGFDKDGNYNFGIREQIVFPEIEYDKIDGIRGLDVAITIKAKSVAESRALLAAFNFPFKD